MSLYLSAHELADLVGCESNQYACMARWLDRGGWPYVRNRMGLPKVLKAYHDSRMAGNKPSTDTANEPNFAAIA